MITRLLISFSLLTCFCIHPSSGQDYHPMPTGPARWDIARCWYFYPGGWYDRYYVEMDGSDTILNGKVYKKLWHTTHHAPGTEFDSTYTHFLGGMREADRQVFLFSEYLCLDTFERKIYDFREVSVGDTIHTQVLTNGLTQTVAHIVTAIGTTEVDGELHRQIEMRDENSFFTELWTEGVGSSMGLPYASYWILTDNSYDLNCFYVGNALAYHNQTPAFAFCTPPLPPADCEPIISSAEDDVKEHDVVLFPNPTTGYVWFQGEFPFHTIAIYNAQGMAVHFDYGTYGLDLHHLPCGMYYVVISTTTDRYIGKVVRL